MNLLALKNRIKSVKNIGQVTKAMELVAATKMRKAQQRITESRNYTQELHKTLHSLCTTEELPTYGLARENTSIHKNLLIVVGPSKGLAGSLISNIAKETYTYLKTHSDTDIIAIEKKGTYIAEHTGKIIIAALDHVKASVEEYELEAIYDIVRQAYVSGQYRKVSIVHAHFVNTLVQHARTVDLLPIKIHATSDEYAHATDVIIEPDKKQVVEYMLNKYFENTIFQSVLDSIASEYSARMIAMKSASDNATELRSELVLEYNQSRQAAITQQILEIAGATAAMEDN